MSRFWKDALPLAGAGLMLTLVGAVLDFAITTATVDGFMRDWVAQNGYGGSTDLSLGIVFSAMFAFRWWRGCCWSWRCRW